MSRRLSSRHGSLFVAGPDLLSLADEVNRNFGQVIWLAFAAFRMARAQRNPLRSGRANGPASAGGLTCSGGNFLVSRGGAAVA